MPVRVFVDFSALIGIGEMSQDKQVSRRQSDLSRTGQVRTIQRTKATLLDCLGSRSRRGQNDCWRGKRKQQTAVDRIPDVGFYREGLCPDSDRQDKCRACHAIVTLDLAHVRRLGMSGYCFEVIAPGICVSAHGQGKKRKQQKNYSKSTSRPNPAQGAPKPDHGNSHRKHCGRPFSLAVPASLALSAIPFQRCTSVHRPPHARFPRGKVNRSWTHRNHELVISRTEIFRPKPASRDLGSIFSEQSVACRK